ncbi:MAG: tetratricopeptide repeat protein [Candidatus Aminicenantes bacterium]|nr:tetratricopeptide repeat protein [Candidatus Aminicenantes bacterium]
MSRKRRFILVTFAAALLAAAAAVFLQPWRPKFDRLRAGQKLNVILVTVDTLRADRLGCYGFRGVKTPVIDTLAAEGVRFSRCMAQTPLTLPSHTTILTGTLPLFHGVRDNGGFVVPPGLATLAESFKEAGYATSAFVAAYVLDGKWGLNRGFDTYFDKFDLSRFEKISLGSVQRPANEVLDEALGWLSKAQDGPFFSWVHLYDPHTPYEPPPPFDAQYPNHPYLGEVAFTDAQLGRLASFLETSGLKDKTVLIFASDHGESLGAHQEATHGFFVYQEAIHVPLIVSTPYSRLRGVVSDRVVSLADVMPTALEMSGLDIPPQVQGTSLVPLFFDPGRDLDGTGWAYSETYYPRFHFGWSELRSFMDDRHKIIISPDVELYDLQTDVREQRNLAADVGLLAPLRDEALRFIEERSRGAFTADMKGVDEETRQRLAALGYVGTFADPARLKGKALASPRDKIGVFNELSRAREMGLEGKADEAVRIIQAIIASDPDITDAHFSLGNVFFKAERFPEAAAAFQKALDLRPDDAFTVINIANSYQRMGKADEAERFVLDHIGRGFEDPQLFFLLGRLSFDRKKYDAAIPFYEKCLSLNAESAASHNALAAIFILKDDLEKAERHLAAGAEINPRLYSLNYNYAQLFEKRGELDRAVQAYLKELDYSPKNFRASYNLARLFRKLGRDEDDFKYLKLTLDLAPDFPLSYFYLARVYLNRGENFAEAIALAKKGLELKPEPAEAPLGYFLLADLYNRQGEVEKSMEFARKGRAAVPKK